jgi:hypothetical protein
MHRIKFKIGVVIFAMAIVIVALQTSGEQKPGDEKPKNLKVLPKNISHEELIQTMKGFCRALGVRCTECHVSVAGTQPDKPEFDFASDAKPEKNTARVMLKMVSAINNKYISKAGDGKFEEVTCVTCHMGNLKPTVSVDSLPKKLTH